MQRTRVLFVADCPSSKNIDPNIPFIGTKSHEKFSGWTEQMGMNEFLVMNSHTPVLLHFVKLRYYEGYKLIALGNNASSRLKGMSIPHFKLPHPSPRNRQLNSKEFINKKLEECKQYLKEIK